jgi:hypothetical protein
VVVLGRCLDDYESDATVDAEWVAAALAGAPVRSASAQHLKRRTVSGT